MAFRPRSVKAKKPAATATPAAAPQLPSSSKAPPASASDLSSAAPPAPPLVPRAIAKRHKVLPSASTSAKSIGAAAADEPIASTSKALAEVVLDPKEAERLEQLLSAVENCLCDWGLSMHAESGMQQKLREGKDGCEYLSSGCGGVELMLRGYRRAHPASVCDPTDSGAREDPGRHSQGAAVSRILHRLSELASSLHAVL